MSCKNILRLGEISQTNRGYTIKIVEYINSRNVTVEFIVSGVTKKTTYKHFKNGVLKYPLDKNINGVGYIGIGHYCPTTHKKQYAVWASMIGRCYDKRYQQKQRTYVGCLVSEPWHNFQNFAEWWEEKYSLVAMQKWQLDKDILIKGNKIYSPETCCFVPREINLIFGKNNIKRGDLPIGVQNHKNKFRASIQIYKKTTHLGLFTTVEEAFQAYKTVKEAYIKEVADLWKNKIAEPTYQALINYKVEITD